MSKQQIEALKARQKSLSVIRQDVQQQLSEPGQAYCICNRPLQDILCRSCGYIVVGRVRRVCSIHSTEILLMDLTCCPKCKTTSLLEIKGSDCESPLKKPIEDDSFESKPKPWHKKRYSLDSDRFYSEQFLAGGGDLLTSSHVNTNGRLSEQQATPDNKVKNSQSVKSNIPAWPEASSTTTVPAVRNMQPVNIPEVASLGTTEVTSTITPEGDHNINNCRSPGKSCLQGQTFQQDMQTLVKQMQGQSGATHPIQAQPSEHKESVKATRRPLLQESKFNFKPSSLTSNVSTTNTTTVHIQAVNQMKTARHVTLGSGCLQGQVLNDLKISTVRNDEHVPVNAPKPAAKPLMVDSEVQTDFAVQVIDGAHSSPGYNANLHVRCAAGTQPFSPPVSPLHRFGSLTIGNVSKDYTSTPARQNSQVQTVNMIPVAAQPQTPPPAAFPVQHMQHTSPQLNQVTRQSLSPNINQLRSPNRVEMAQQLAGMCAADRSNTGSPMLGYRYNPRQGINGSTADPDNCDNNNNVNLLQKVLHQRKFPSNTGFSDLSTEDRR